MRRHAYPFWLLLLASCSSPSSEDRDAAIERGDAGTFVPPDAGPVIHGDAGTVVVTTCDGLAASAGTWQNISPFEFTQYRNMETTVVAVNPLDGSVYAAASNGTNPGACPECPMSSTGLMKSTDCGATWTRINDQTPGSDSARLSTGLIWALLIDPETPDVMYAVNGYGELPTVHKSTDGGVHWAPLELDPTGLVDGTFVQAIGMDPRDHNHLAATHHVGCGPDGGPYHWCFSHSTNAGADWTVFDGPSSIEFWEIPSAGWVEGASITVLGPTSFLVTSAVGVWYTSDLGAHWTLVAAVIAQSAYSGGARRASDGNLYIPTGTQGMFVSAAALGEEPPYAIQQAPSLPVPTPRLPYQTGLSPAVEPVMNSPSINQVIDDGVTLFASVEGERSFWSAPLANPTQWTNFPENTCVGTVCRGAYQITYDGTHHVIYSANVGSGLWRYVVP